MVKEKSIKAGVLLSVLFGLLSFPVTGEILDYVDNRVEIRNNLERFPRESSDFLLDKLDYIYDASIFRRQELIYNGLLKLYIDDRISDRKLLDAWLHVELIDQFGTMDKSSTVEVLGATAVDRIDLNEFPVWRECYLKKISGARGKAFAETLDDKIGKCPVYFSRVLLTDEEREHLLATRGSDVGPDYQNIFHLRQWIMRRADMNPEFCCFIEEKGVLLFASYSFFEDVLLSSSCYFIKPVPVLGTTEADHLFTLRSENKHPVVLFHPQVSNNFLYPHRR
ncbi:hypothetical protein ACWJJH_11570 [Endozoicomonadaceae bacterium StTr2]